MGKLIGIGIGPGEPELLTLKAQRALAQADLVFVPQGRLDKGSVAQQIASQYIKENARIIQILLPMTKEQEVLEQAWQRGAEQVVAALAGGKTGAFITLGDCMLYSTYTYILKKVKQLAPEIEIENIPGITSFAAAACTLDLPLAEGAEDLVIIPALNNWHRLPQLLQLHDNIVFLKVATKMKELVKILQSLGLQEKAVFVSKCGHPDQEIIYDLASLPEGGLEYLSLLVVKKGGVK